MRTARVRRLVTLENIGACHRLQWLPLQAEAFGDGEYVASCLSSMIAWL